MLDVGTDRLNPLLHTSLDIKLDGTRLSALQLADLLEVRIQVGVRTIGRASLTFVDRTYALAKSTLAMGSTVSISVVGSGTELFRGRITAVSTEAGPDGAHASITVHDASYELSRDRAVEAFQIMTAAAVVAKIAADGGMTLSADLPGSARDWSLRADSRLGLIDEVATRARCDWVVEGSTLAIWDSVTGTAPQADAKPTLELGEDLVSFSARQVGDGPTTFTVRGWDLTQQVAVSGTATTPRSRAGFVAAGTQRSATSTVLSSRQATTSAEEAKSVAGALAAASGRVTARGRGHFLPTVRPGGEVTVAQAGPADGTYYVREVEHVFDASTARTTFVAGDRDPVRLSDPWGAPPASSSLFRTGLTVGIVDNVDDPDKRGRVRVKLASVADDVASAWARVVSVGGGNARGLVVLPEVNDEVLVAFEDDDVRRPVVLGGLHNTTSKVPDRLKVDGGKVHTRGLTSRLGHRVELADGDAPAAQHIELALGGDGAYRLRIGKDRLDLEVPDNVPLRIGSGAASIEFDGKGGITINATTLTVKTDGPTQIEGAKVTVKAKAQLELSGVQATLSGSATAKLTSGSMTEVSGSIVKIN